MLNLDEENFTPLSFKQKIQILLQLIQNLKIDNSLKEAYFQKLIFFSKNYREPQNLQQKPLETVGDQVLNLLYVFIDTINDLERNSEDSFLNTIQLNSFKSLTSKMHGNSQSLHNQNSSNWSLSNHSQPIQKIKPKLSNKYQMDFKNYREIPTDIKYSINKQHQRYQQEQQEVMTLQDLLYKTQQSNSKK